MKKNLKIALLSDLHAFMPNEKRKDISYLPVSPTASDPDPFRDLDALLGKYAPRLTVDLLICPGDICDQADYKGFQFAWTKLNALKANLGASELIATCGNHDLDSRHKYDPDDDPDPKGALQQVTPQFPFSEDADCNHYWARNFAVRFPGDDVRVIVLNTSAFHGGAEGELHHGRVSLRTIRAIQKALEDDAKKYKINLLVCHHHLRPLEAWGTSTDKQYVSKGSELLRMLSDTTGTPWVVLHGHRHSSNIEHAQTPAYVMIGASSFSKPEFDKANQFHLIDLTIDPSDRHRAIFGTIESWNWTRSGGWAQGVIEPGAGLPAHCGFGFTGGVPSLAGEVADSVSKAGFLDWGAVTSVHEDIRYLPPAERRKFFKELESLNIGVNYDARGQVTQLGRSR